MASASEAGSGWHHGAPFKYTEGMLGDDRACWHDCGVDLHFSTIVIGQKIIDGGTERKGVISASYDAQLYLDTEKLGWWKNGYALLRLEGKTNDDGVNLFTGALVPVNFDAAVPVPEGKDLEATEWWYSHVFLQGKLELLGGMWDIGRFYDLSPFSGPYHFRFLNAHMFFNSTLLPWAPYNRLGALALAKPNDCLTITTGVADPGSSAIEVDWFEDGDWDLLQEWRAIVQPFGKDHPTQLGVGAAYRKKNQPLLENPGQTRSSDWTLWGNFNQWLYKDPDNPTRSIGLFARVGHTDGKINNIKNHYSLGVTFEGIARTRQYDVFGIAGWYNKFSKDSFIAQKGNSSGIELFYNFRVTPWLQITPDLQYLIGPALDPDVNETFVVGTRFLFLL
ncbi:carbohydrate porin [Microbulbifer agarilyticus]|uniref:carbohydrate porin n=1 Tax=Microbulbifer agarilyticus TaxID=260552 RepID=UPI001CD717CA|nr:carbohydrate porin [Microbulbifer agarilyticus]MCA0895112.1 carbohydrate porin [Microbulbifer agarilyticus]